MRPKTHFIVSLLLFLALFTFFRYSALLVFVGGFFIDIDHYLHYIIKKKSFSLKKTYRFCIHKKRKFSNVVCIFHNFEFVILMFLLGFFSKYFKIIAIGVVVHFMMDLIYVHTHRNLREELSALSLIARFVVRKSK